MLTRRHLTARGRLSTCPGKDGRARARWGQALFIEFTLAAVGATVIAFIGARVAQWALGAMSASTVAYNQSRLSATQAGTVGQPPPAVTPALNLIGPDGPESLGAFASPVGYISMPAGCAAAGGIVQGKVTRAQVAILLGKATVALQQAQVNAIAAYNPLTQTGRYADANRMMIDAIAADGYEAIIRACDGCWATVCKKGSPPQDCNPDLDPLCICFDKQDGNKACVTKRTDAERALRAILAKWPGATNARTLRVMAYLMANSAAAKQTSAVTGISNVISLGGAAGQLLISAETAETNTLRACK